MSSLSYMATPSPPSPLGSTRNGNDCFPPSASTSARCTRASFGHGRTSTDRSSCVSASRTLLQKGHASNS
eukprot:26007-Pelagococcus_subviridis.AAC.2